MMSLVYFPTHANGVQAKVFQILTLLEVVLVTLIIARIKHLTTSNLRKNEQFILANSSKRYNPTWLRPQQLVTLR